MAEHDFLLHITQREWLEGLEALILGLPPLAELEPKNPTSDGVKLTQEQIDSYRLLARWFFRGDLLAGIEYYTSKNRPIPPSIGRAILQEQSRPPRKGGRHSRREQWAKQQASDKTCHMAMEYLLAAEPDLSQTAAAERIAELMSGPDKPNLCYQAVVRAWKKETQDLKKEIQAL